MTIDCAHESDDDEGDGEIDEEMVDEDDVRNSEWKSMITRMSIAFLISSGEVVRSVI